MQVIDNSKHHDNQNERELLLGGGYGGRQPPATDLAALPGAITAARAS
jgi:hypothetical protein